jgi:hypothetical protein
MRFVCVKPVAQPVVGSAVPPRNSALASPGVTVARLSKVVMVSSLSH